MTVFFLVRHGQSEGNLRNEFIGHGNARLTELGRAQAQKTGEYLSSVQFDYAYGSDLLRAFETGEIILKNRDIELIPDKMLREIHAGEWEGKTFSELEQTFSRSYGVWKTNIGLAEPEGGETVRALFDRVTAEIVRLSEVHPNKTVLIATHATPIRCVMAKAKGLSYDKMSRIPWSPNSSVTVVGVENGAFTLISEPTAAHLGEIATFLPSNV